MKKIFLKFFEFIQVRYLFYVPVFVASGLFLYLGIKEDYFMIIRKWIFAPFFMVLLVFFVHFFLNYFDFLKLCQTGIRKPGRIVQVEYFGQGYYYLVWEYDFQGFVYRSSITTGKPFQAGQAVLVTVDPKNPKRSQIDDLYA